MDIKGKRLRLLFSDVLGVERGKYLFGDVADAGHSAFCVGVYPLTTDKEIPVSEPAECPHPLSHRDGGRCRACGRPVGASPVYSPAHRAARRKLSCSASSRSYQRPASAPGRCAAAASRSANAT